MSQPFAQKNFVPGTSRGSRNARTVLLRMAADQDRADRIRQLKQDHPETTWQAIADYCHVTVRAAQAWQETGGIAYENAKRLAELWGESVDYIMRGPRGNTPDLSNGGTSDGLAAEVRDRLAGMEQEVAALRVALRELIATGRGEEPNGKEQAG